MVDATPRRKLGASDWMLIALFPLNLALQIIGWLMLETARALLWIAGKILRLNA